MDTSIFNEMTALAMCSNLSEAARLLNTSPSVLSRHITQTEKQLGVTLFNRKQGSPLVTTTLQGDIFIQSAQRIQLELNQMRLNLARSTRQNAPTTIGSSFDLLLADSSLFARVKDQCGDYQFLITNPRNEVSLSLLKEGNVDLAFEPLSTYLTEVINLHGIEHFLLFKEPTYLMVSQEDPIASLNAVSVDQLSAFVFLQTYAKNESCIEAHLVEMFREHGFQAKTEILPYDNPLMMYRDRLQPGYGALVAASYLPRLQADITGSRFVPFFEDETALPMSLFYRTSAKPSILKAFAENAEHYQPAKPSAK